MSKRLKNAVQIAGVIVLAVQLTGCYYGGDRHYHPWWHHDVVDVHVHG
jgi:hypothetical protein